MADFAAVHAAHVAVSPTGFDYEPGTLCLADGERVLRETGIKQAEREHDERDGEPVALLGRHGGCTHEKRAGIYFRNAVLLLL